MDCVGSEERLNALFNEHYRVVARFLRTRGHSGADVEDLISATFEVAWRQIDAVPEGREAVPWLLGVARNLSRNAWRKAQREVSFIDALPSTTVAWAEMPVVERAEITEVMRALARLKPLDRDLILLVVWDELSPTEAGRVLGLRPVAARSRLHRARQRLHALLEEPAVAGSASAPRFELPGESDHA
jgi:RNA polymerase sigma-70 factor (ECF subfamily)